MSTLSNLSPSLTAATSPVPAESPNPFAELGSTEFVRILVEELSNQDPFEPNDSAAILEQLSSLRSIESDLSLQNQLENLVLQNSIGQAGALIGREVQGLSTSNEVVSGVVTSVRVVDGQTEVQLDNGQGLPLERITEIAEVPTPAAVIPPAVLAAARPVTTLPTTGLTTAAESADFALLDESLASDAEGAADG